MKAYRWILTTAAVVAASPAFASDREPASVSATPVMEILVVTAKRPSTSTASEASAPPSPRVAEPAAFEPGEITLEVERPEINEIVIELEAPQVELALGALTRISL